MGILATHARTDILDLKQEDGIFFDLVDKAEWYIITNTRNRVDTFTGGPSPVYPEIPRDALREALMNAFVHRDWQTYDAVVVDIYNDAVEILSPGWFIKGQDPDSHLSGENKSSKSRNPLITRTLYRSGDIEAYGTGIKRIKDLCDEAGLEVEYRHAPSGTNLIFHRNDPFGQSLVIDPLGDKLPDDNLNDSLFDSLSERDSRVLRVIAEDPKSTAAQISKKLKMSESTANRAMKSLQEQGLITREGSKKTGKWIVRADEPR